jgi:1-deoxy-D-xylulose-5-phosphate synthase
MLYTGFQHDGPAAVRYPRGQGPGIAIEADMQALPIGKAEVRREGQRVAILAFGAMVAAAEEAGETLDATVVNMRFVKPLDEERVIELATKHDLIVTVEDNARLGGAGSAVNEVLASMKDSPQILNLGLPDRFIDQGSREELLSLCGLDSTGIIHSIEDAIAEFSITPLPVGANSK